MLKISFKEWSKRIERTPKKKRKGRTLFVVNKENEKERWHAPKLSLNDISAVLEGVMDLDGKITTRVVVCSRLLILALLLRMTRDWYDPRT